MLERKIYIFAKSVDMRKQMNGLIQIAKNEFEGQIFSTSTVLRVSQSTFGKPL